MGIFLDILSIIGGLVLILMGANALTDGSSALAKRFGLSDLVIGLTVVAFGTSAPELVISMVSAVGGSSELAIGNAVGSNLFNILVIIGLTAMVRPIKIEKSVMSREIPMVIISSLAILVMGNKGLLDGAPGSFLSRTNGLILLLFFAIFMWYVLATAKKESTVDPSVSDGPATGKYSDTSIISPNSDDPSQKRMSLTKAVIFVILGLAALIFGGDIFVKGASGVAAILGVSEAVIGLTIAAAGTSLPELATSIVAARKGQTGLAIGNVIGSCIFNIFCVLGLSATISPLSFGTIGNLDLMTLMGASLMFLIFGWWFGDKKFTRVEGALMFGCYIAYTTVLVLNA